MEVTNTEGTRLAIQTSVPGVNKHRHANGGCQRLDRCCKQSEEQTMARGRNDVANLGRLQSLEGRMEQIMEESDGQGEPQARTRQACVLGVVMA